MGPELFSSVGLAASPSVGLAARGKQFPSVARIFLISYLPQNVAVQDGPHVVEVSR